MRLLVVFLAVAVLITGMLAFSGSDSRSSELSRYAFLGFSGLFFGSLIVLGVGHYRGRGHHRGRGH